MSIGLGLLPLPFPMLLDLTIILKELVFFMQILILFGYWVLLQNGLSFWRESFGSWILHFLLPLQIL